MVDEQYDDDVTAVPTRRPKWEVYTDESGNMYFYNTITGETAWELPENDASEEEDDAENNAQDEDVHVTATGETVVRNQMRDDVGNVLELTVVRPKYSQYQIAVEVIETTIQLLDDVEVAIDKLGKSGKKAKRFVSPAAEARAKKNEANVEKRRKRERLLAMTRYMNVLIPPVMTSSAMESSLLGGKQPVGALFSREDAKKWRLEKEVQQIRQRYKTRKNKAKHHGQVVTRATHHQFLKDFRTNMLNHFIAQIPCSSELQQQRILLMTSPQQLAEMELQRKATLEPEMLERYEAEQRVNRETSSKSLKKVFVLADREAVGSMHLLQTLVTMFSDERAQKYALKVRGLAEIIQRAEIQRFVVDYVSDHQPQECKLSLPQFEEFVQTIEDAVDHYTNVKQAVEDAENEIAAAIEASAAKGSSGAGSLLRARLNMVSKKKVEQEMAALKATQQHLEAKIKRETRAPYSDSGDDNLALMMAKEEWEMHHQHRYIQVEAWLPVYCCLCRRRKWELWRQELETEESEYRATYANRYALKTKSEELRLIREENGDETNAAGIDQDVPQLDTPCGQPANSGSRTIEAPVVTKSDDEFSDRFLLLDDDGTVVLQVLRTLVLMTERIHSEDAVKPPPPRMEHKRVVAPKQQQTGSPRKKKKKKRKDDKKMKNGEGGEDDEEELDELELAMKIFESEDRERNLMRVEDTSMHIYLERNRRLVERPLLQHQDMAYNAYIRLLSHCVNPSSLLYRLRFERSMSFDPPQQLVLHMSDGATSQGSCILPSRQLVLQTVPCRSESEAAFVFYQVQQMQTKLKSPFVADIASCSKHTYQFFAESGLLVECWPVIFVAVEYFPHGTWQEAFTRAIETGTVRDFGEAEAVIMRVFRDVAAGLAAMHSSGILHLNTNLGNLFIPEPPSPIGNGEDPDNERLQLLYNIRLGGMLACKRSFDEGQLRRGDMVHCLNNATTPPEAASGLPVSGKADVWMVGCALWEALMIWQRYQLRGRGHLRTLPTTSTVIRLKTIPDLLQEIPLATSAALRSLLRMLLQPNPSQRPQMSQVVDILSFASRKAGPTNH